MSSFRHWPCMSKTNALTVYSASSFYQRLRGLLFASPLSLNEALHIARCSDVHTIGMTYPIDVVFLDSANRVLRIVNVKPNRWAWCRGAKAVIELTSRGASTHGFVVGDVAPVIGHVRPTAWQLIKGQAQ